MKFEKINEDITKHVYIQQPDDSYSYDCIDELNSVVDEYDIAITGNTHFMEFGRRTLLDIIDGTYEDEDNEDYSTLDELKKVTGKEYSECTLRGYSQGDWQNIYYPSDTDKSVLDEIEMYLFNKYDEFIEEDNNYPIIVPRDIVCKGAKAIKEYIHEIENVPLDSIALKKFDGYIKTPKYTEFEESIEDRNIDPLKDFPRRIWKFDSGDYVYINYEDGKLYGDSSTNTGIFHDEDQCIDYDWDESVEDNIQRLITKIEQKHPEYTKLAESIDIKNLKRYTIGDPYDDFDGDVDMLVDDVQAEELQEDYLDDRNNLAKINIRDWYCAEFPTDELGKEINPELTLKDAYVFLKVYGGKGDDEHGDFYDYIGDGIDSIVRERIFSKLAKEMNCSYDDIYNLWLKESIDKIRGTNNKVDAILENLQKMVDEDINTGRRVSKKTWHLLKKEGYSLLKNEDGTTEVVKNSK